MKFFEKFFKKHRKNGNLGGKNRILSVCPSKRPRMHRSYLCLSICSRLVCVRKSAESLLFMRNRLSITKSAEKKHLCRFLFPRDPSIRYF